MVSINFFSLLLFSYATRPNTVSTYLLISPIFFSALHSDHLWAPSPPRAQTALAAAAVGHQRTLLELLASGGRDRDAVADALRAMPLDMLARHGSANANGGLNGGGGGLYVDGDDSDSEEQRVAARKIAHAHAVAAAAEAAKARSEAAAAKKAAAAALNLGGDGSSAAGGGGGGSGSGGAGGKQLSIEEAAVEAMRATLARAALEVCMMLCYPRVQIGFSVCESYFVLFRCCRGVFIGASSILLTVILCIEFMFLV